MTKATNLNTIITDPRQLPSVEELLRDPRLEALSAQIPRSTLVAIVREVVASKRESLRPSALPAKKGAAKKTPVVVGATAPSQAVTRNNLVSAILTRATGAFTASLRRVINCTGVVAHTNLGRAPIGGAAFLALADALSGYTALEYDIAAGERGQRGAEVEAALSAVTGAESTMVVNSCAAALVLTLNTFSLRRETIVSRGELVQIGGGFRVLDILRRAGAKLVEIGATNITTRKDYEKALHEKTGLILKVHQSNFEQVGFAESVALRELVALGKSRKIPVIHDLGSGLVVDPREVGLGGETNVIASVRQGADLTLFSGDKLFGAAQAGIIAGRKEMIARLKTNPLYRALRVDKITLALTFAAAQSYLAGNWRTQIPLWKLALRSESDLYQLGRDILAQLDAGDMIAIEAVTARVGGGAAPTRQLPSCALSFITSIALDRLAEMFRESNPPIIGRIENGRFLLDLKALLPGEERALMEAIRIHLPQLRAGVAPASSGPVAPAKTASPHRAGRSGR